MAFLLPGIKPNPQNLPDLFDRKAFQGLLNLWGRKDLKITVDLQGVTEQLRYGGVLQVVQVSWALSLAQLPHLRVHALAGCHLAPCSLCFGT